jgi:hypothetical protein
MHNKVTIMIEQAIQTLATGWKAEGLKFESRQGQVLSPLHVVQTDSGAHQASYPKGTRWLFSRG